MRYKFLVAAAGCALLSRPCAASTDPWAKYPPLDENRLNPRETATTFSSRAQHAR